MPNTRTHSLGLAALLMLGAWAEACADDEPAPPPPDDGGGAAGGSGGTGGAVVGSGGAGGAAECAVAEDCPGLAKECRYPACLDGACALENAPSGALCDEGDDRRVCDGEGRCVKNLGAGCLSGYDCHSGICIDGLCCDAVCTGGCESCALTGSEGMCTPHPGDSDPESACSDGAGVCDGGGSCADGTHRFSVTFGNAVDQEGLAVAADAAGAVFVGGRYDGVLDLSGQNPMTDGDEYDAFVAKLSPAGVYNWSLHFADAGAQSVNAVTVAGDDEVVFAGAYETSITIGPTARTSAGASDLFVAKLDTNGVYAWDGSFGGVGSDRASAVAVDDQGRVVVVGEVEGTVSFDGGNTMLTSAGMSDVFVLVLDDTGAHVWSSIHGGTGADRATGVALDGGDILLTGSFTTDIDFGSGVLSSAGGEDIFVAKLDADGNALWAQAYGDTGTDVANAIGADDLGNVTIAGSIEGTVSFGGSDLNVAGSRDAFVARLAPDGAHLASNNYGTNAEQAATGVAVDPSGAIVLVGAYRGNINFGDGNLGTSGATPDGFFVKLGPDLTPVYRRRFDSLNNAPTTATLDATGEPVVTGSIGGPCNFGGGTRPHAGGTDIFVAKYRR